MLIATQGSYVSLVLARDLERLGGTERRLVLAGSAFALGISIWAMHFVGMLAYHFPVEITFDVFGTLLSVLVAILVVGIGYGVMASEGRWRLRLLGAALFTGSGISGMHYIGMAALRGPVTVSYDPAWVAASVFVGIAAAGGSFALAFQSARRLNVVMASAVLGFAISGMHFAAMTGTTVAGTASSLAEASGRIASPVFSRDLLAIVVALVAFAICAVSLLLLLPDRPRDLALSAASLPSPAVDAVAGPAPATAVSPAPAVARADSLKIDLTAQIPELSIDDIRAVRADGRYTHLCDGDREVFCSLSISELEKRLDPLHFLRVHRSYIIQLKHIKSLKKRGDQATAFVDGHGGFKVPVSRSALPQLKQRLPPKLMQN